MDQMQQVMLSMLMSQNGGGQQEHPLSRAFGGVPMYNGFNSSTAMFDLSGIPGFTGNSSGGQMVGMLMQGILPGLMGPNMTPGQFAPTQNLYDHRYALQNFMARRQAMEQASSSNTDTYFRMIRGAARMRGIEYTPGGSQEQAAHRLAQDVAPLMTMAGQMFPEFIDSLHGIRGDATQLTGSLFNAGRYSFDPVTGGLGMTGDSARDVSQQVFLQLYGPGANLQRMRGIGAGRAGAMYEELQKRGFGANVGLSPEEQGRMMRRDGAVGADVELNSPAFEAASRSFNATRTSQTIERMAGAVSAMRDIFGDMGRPNAPMVELLNGLQAMTQGGLSHMTGQQIESSVRQTYAVAKYTGLGLEGMMGFNGTASQLMSQMGMNRALAPSIAREAALFGFAFGQGQQPTNYGAMDREMASQLDLNLRANATQSRQFAQLSALMQFSDEFSRGPGAGQAGFAANTEAYAVSQAVRAGQTTYTFNGQNRSIFQNQDRILGMLTAAGVNENSAATAVTQSSQAAGAYGERYNLANLTRHAQFDLDVVPAIGSVYSSAFGVGLAGRRGMAPERQAGLARQMGPVLLEEERKLFAENKELFSRGRERELQQTLEGRVRARLGASLDGISPTDLSNMISSARRSGNEFIVQPGGQFSGYGGMLGILQAHDTSTFAAATRARGATEGIAQFQQALSAAGQAGLAARFSDYLQDLGGTNGSVGDFLLTMAGGIGTDEVRNAAASMADYVQQLEARAANPATRAQALADLARIAPDMIHLANGGGIEGLSAEGRTRAEAFRGQQRPGTTRTPAQQRMIDTGQAAGQERRAAIDANPAVRAAMDAVHVQQTEMGEIDPSDAAGMAAARAALSTADADLQRLRGQAGREFDVGPGANSPVQQAYRDARRAAGADPMGNSPAGGGVSVRDAQHVEITARQVVLTNSGVGLETAGSPGHADVNRDAVSGATGTQQIRGRLIIEGLDSAILEAMGTGEGGTTDPRSLGRRAP